MQTHANTYRIEYVETAAADGNENLCVLVNDEAAQGLGRSLDLTSEHNIVFGEKLINKHKYEIMKMHYSHKF